MPTEKKLRPTHKTRFKKKETINKHLKNYERSFYQTFRRFPRPDELPRYKYEPSSKRPGTNNGSTKSKETAPNAASTSRSNKEQDEDKSFTSSNNKNDPDEGYRIAKNKSNDDEENTSNNGMYGDVNNDDDIQEHLNMSGNSNGTTNRDDDEDFDHCNDVYGGSNRIDETTDDEEYMNNEMEIELKSEMDDDKDNNDNNENDNDNDDNDEENISESDDNGEYVFGPDDYCIDGNNDNDGVDNDGDDHDGDDHDGDDHDGDDDDGDDDDGDGNDDNNDENENEDDVRMFNIKPGNVVTMRPNVREGDIITTVIAIALRYKLCFEAVLAMLSLFKHYINESTIPTTRNMLWKCLGRREQNFQTRHEYCRSCLIVIGSDGLPVNSCLCKVPDPEKALTNTSFFIQLNITAQLKRMLAIPNFIKLLRYRYDRKKLKDTAMEDIFDGLGYKKLQKDGQFLNSEFNYSFTLNTDGCQVSKSSKSSAWPVLLTINELPPHSRKRYMILAGIYVDKDNPNLITYMKPIMKELLKLYNTGIKWKPDGHQTVTSKFMTTTCTVDSMARWEILQMKIFHGKYGCTFCYAPGAVVSQLNRKYPVKEFRDRTDKQIRAHMSKATTSGQPVYGVRGNSVLRLLPEFDLREGMVVDGMHNPYLGVAKTLTELIMFSPAVCLWYFGKPNNRTKINNRLAKIRTPSRISRKPRKIDDCKNWKASEWRNWVLYYAVPCLTGIIPDEYVSLFCKISEALHILNSYSLNGSDVRRADDLIDEFVKQYEHMFGIANMTYNIHILRHLVKSVRYWGPIWVHSTFIYEAFNKKIVESLHGPTGRPLQIMNKYLLNDFMRCVMHDGTVKEELRRKVLDIFNAGKRRPFINHDIGVEMQNFQGFGMSLTRNPSRSERAALTAGQQTCNGKLTIYKKAIINGTYYCSCDGEGTNKKNCDKYVYATTKQFAEILSIVTFKNNEGITINGIFVCDFESTGILCEAKHIQSLRSKKNIGFLQEYDIIVPAIIQKLENIEYGVRMANVWETD